jgi:hypothetical protein
VQVVQAVLQRETVPPPLAEVLLAKAQGNPFFLEELAQTLMEQDVGQGMPTGQSPRPVLPDRQLPPTVQAVLAARIDRLAPEAKRLLQTAAVVGMDVPVPLRYILRLATSAGPPSCSGGPSRRRIESLARSVQAFGAYPGRGWRGSWACSGPSPRAGAMERRRSASLRWQAEGSP